MTGPRDDWAAFPVAAATPDDPPLARAPPWALILERALSAAAEFPGVASLEGSDEHLVPGDPLPFEEALLPFVWVARRAIAQAAEIGGFAVTAERQIGRGLLRALSQIASGTLYAEFSVFRVVRRSSFDRLLARTSGADAAYRGYVRGLLAGELLPVLRRHAALARALATLTLSWIDNATEMATRLATDRPALATIFGADPGAVISVLPYLSDSHHGGRSVAALFFERGPALVYKPREMGVDVAYAALLDWINRRGSMLPLTELRVLDRGTHGWVERVEHRPCPDAGGAERYYVRGGMHLALLHALYGTDCHCENLIADGDQPVLIDLETLLHPDRREPEAPNPVPRAFEVADRKVRGSVLRTEFLPSWFLPATGPAAEVSGLGSVREERKTGLGLVFHHVNTDAMTLARRTVALDPEPGAPSLHGTVLSPNHHPDAIAQGFGGMYRFLIAERAALLAPGGPLDAFAGCKVRFIHRSTPVYIALLNRSLQPAALRDGDARWKALGGLASAARDPASIVAEERRCLFALDIPRFTARTDGTALVLTSGEVIPDFFASPSLDAARARIEALDEADLAYQTDLIHAALHARVARRVPRPHVVSASAERADAPICDEVLTSDELIAEATAIAEEIARRAIRTPDGTAAWIGLSYDAGHDRYRIAPLGPTLFDGAAGVALFLAAEAALTRNDAHRALAIGALAPSMAMLSAGTGPMGPGGLTGLGSLVYVLTKVASLVDDSRLLAEARDAAARLGAALDRCVSDDVFEGAAGAVLALLSLYDAAPEQGFLDAANRYGERLVAHGRSRGVVQSDPTLTGFSHGAAGIACALLRLHAASGRDDFRTAALDAIAYERSVFDPARGWPDFRTQPAGFVNAWCNGAAGIGMARVASLDRLDDEGVRAEIAAAVAASLAPAADAGLDHLCCGGLGRAAFLRLAGERLPQAALVDAARRHASRRVHRARAAGGFDLGHTGRVYNPSFFQGVSGIGYELLCLSGRRALPAVLVFG